MIGRFHVLGMLGRGGAGAVCAAHDPVLDRKVALKVLLPVFQGPDATHHRERLLREAQVMARVSHPNVVTVFEAGTTTDGCVFVMMELVDGGTLRTWLSERPRSWRDIVHMLRAAGAGLAAAHAAGIVHRDFKLDNILVGADGRPRVSDFGISHWSATAARSTGMRRYNEVLGTVGYMALEQYEGGPTDTRTDVFGFCAATYRALYGHSPFPTDDQAETVKALRAHAVRPRPRMSPIPRSVHRVLVRGLDPDPDRRPSLEEIRQALADRPYPLSRSILVGAFIGTVLGGAYILEGDRRPGAVALDGIRSEHAVQTASAPVTRGMAAATAPSAGPPAGGASPLTSSRQATNAARPVALSRAAGVPPPRLPAPSATATGNAEHPPAAPVADDVPQTPISQSDVF
jgi:serine/threonine protein kinase